MTFSTTIDCRFKMHKVSHWQRTGWNSAKPVAFCMVFFPKDEKIISKHSVNSVKSETISGSDLWKTKCKMDIIRTYKIPINKMKIDCTSESKGGIHHAYLDPLKPLHG